MAEDKQDENGENGDGKGVRGTTKITFTKEQQAHIDKIIGDARVKAREKAKADHDAQTSKDKDAAEQAALVAKQQWQKLAEKHEARVKELEPLEAKAKAYEELIEGMLKDTIEKMGEGAKKAVEALPASMSAVEKLDWLNKNEELFQVKGDGVGTPKPAAKQTKTTKGKEKLYDKPFL